MGTMEMYFSLPAYFYLIPDVNCFSNTQAYQWADRFQVRPTIYILQLLAAAEQLPAREGMFQGLEWNVTCTDDMLLASHIDSFSIDS